LIPKAQWLIEQGCRFDRHEHRNGASDLERIGDLAENVAKRVLLLTEEFEIGEAICRSLVPPGWSRIRL